MKPKAKRYRISPKEGQSEKKNAPETGEDQVETLSEEATPSKSKAEAARMMEDAQPFSASTEDGFGAQAFPTRKEPATDADDNEAIASEGDTLSPAAAIDAIRREGLTGRQLRMARRVAQKHGLTPTSDFDAVRLLRERGVNPFKRSNMLELVVNEEEQAPALQGVANVPATAPETAPIPAPSPLTPEERAAEIMGIQKDIIRRRRRRATFLFLRLAAFVFIPTILAGIYFYKLATPMYGTKSEFVIQQADQGGGSQLGSLFSGTGFANSQDSIVVQGYLQSRDAMLRLDKDEGFRAHFSQDHIDSLQNLAIDASNEDAYKVYKKRVLIGYDPTEGVVRMEVVAADPDTSERFSNKLISYAEARVDALTERLRADQMAGAEKSRLEANEKMIAAQDRIVELQEKLGVLNPESEVQAIFGQIGQLESELLNERLSLQGFLGNDRPNQAKVSASRNKIVELEKLIDEKRNQLTSSTENSESLARVTGELLVAQADLETRQSLLAQAEAQFEVARLEANRQVRYLSVSVSPTAPDKPTYPRAFENTMIALLIFGGIYLMVSLTVSILREQV